MDTKERYEALLNEFYSYKGKREIIYMTIMGTVCFLFIAAVYYLQNKLPDIYNLTSTKIIFMTAILIVFTVHIVCKMLFLKIFKYTSFYNKAFSRFTPEETAEVREFVKYDLENVPNAAKDPFFRTIAFFLNQESI